MTNRLDPLIPLRLVAKVRFLIHPSYHPHDLIEVTQPPFHLTRRGWGEFPARVQIHFRDPRDKPVEVIHNLKLDKTYTGLQTLGGETLVDVWLHNPDYGRDELKKKKEKSAADEDFEEAAKYKLTETEAEGWVICHTEAQSLRPSQKEREKEKGKEAVSNALAQPQQKKVLASLERENIMSIGNGPTVLNGNAAAAAPAAGQAPASATSISPPQQRTTLVRCKDKAGETYYLPIKILPQSHQKQQVVSVIQGPVRSARRQQGAQTAAAAAGAAASTTATSAHPAKAGTVLKTLASGKTTITKMEAIMYDNHSTVGSIASASTGASASSLHRVSPPTPTPPKLSNGKINGSISLLSTLKSSLASAERLQHQPVATTTVHHNIAVSQSAPGSRFNSPFTSPQSSPTVSRCSSPVPGATINPGTSLLKSNSLLKPGTSLLKQRVVASKVSPPLPGQTTGPASEVLGFPLAAFQSELEKAVPEVQLQLWSQGRTVGEEDSTACRAFIG